jgi:hypothetical protein
MGAAEAKAQHCTDDPIPREGAVDYETGAAGGLGLAGLDLEPNDA